MLSIVRPSNRLINPQVNAATKFP
uniref:Uncharacterized protein n=1 Tax=Anopheles albimanus TaxID=7167 RepID=A0A182FWM5_ANOAL